MNKSKGTIQDALQSPMWPALRKGCVDNPKSLPQLIALVKAVDPMLGATLENDQAAFIDMVIELEAAQKIQPANVDQEIAEDVEFCNDYLSTVFDGGVIGIHSISLLNEDSEDHQMQQLGLKPFDFDYEINE